MRTKRQLLRHGQWNLGVVRRPVAELLESPAPLRPEWMPARRDRFLADPFAVRVDGRTHGFCEMYDYATAKGVIAHFELGSGGPTEPEAVLEMDVHLSYPFVVESDGEVLLVPETAQAREVAVYRASEFPRGWRRDAVLLRDVAALDPTLVQYEGLWWLFATDGDHGPHDRLCAWYAPELLGPWRPHARNPVKVSRVSARPAGMPFTHEGRLYRPSQDCSQTYGGAVVINRVARLSPEEFAEDEVLSLAPEPDGPYPLGFHTLSAAGEVTLVDGKRMALRGAAATGRSVHRRWRSRMSSS